MEDCEICEILSDSASDVKFESASELSENQSSETNMIMDRDDIKPPRKIDKELSFMSTVLSEKNENQCNTALPKVNCVEKIVICLDLSCEMEKESFRSRAGDKFSQLQVVLKALRLFINSKHKFNMEHEFALVVIDESARWVNDFTNNPKEIITLLDQLRCSTNPESEIFDLSLLFDLISEKVVLPTVEDIVLPPPYIVRIVFLYGRSNCLIESSCLESQRLLESSNYVFFDSLYIHEPLSEENNCEDIFKGLCKLDRRGLSYIFEVSKNPTKLYLYMAQLLAHPLQRVSQQSAAYKLRPLTPDLEQGIPTMPS